ncbi:MAG: 5'-methylthioadenosine nucleosidase [Phycisphaerae bacterium]|jgi:adenosylhomocysteine nucleosidase|nr:5'-methylthioadenosine nucleosidase [Phycisphaerae bacterium]MBT6282916.1 5'-methylthioadenosine nucleosidase [Phycisphaerae bacterium]
MDRMLILTALKEEIPTLHMKENVFVTGLGKVNATMHATRLILEHNPVLVVNFGTAGAVSNEFTHGLVECTGFVQRDMDCSPLGFASFVTPYEEGGHMIGTPGIICGTGDSFVTDTSGFPEASMHIVDMEAYAIAKVCREFRVPFRCFKYISDGADENAGDDWSTFEHAKAEKLFVAQLELLSGKN